jgi:hypothetical protein
MSAVDDLQDNYIRDLRAVLPELEAWWKNLSGVVKMEDPAPPEIMRRWPTTISGHPRVLDIFQTYFFELDYLNQVALQESQARQEAQKQTLIKESDWGETPEPESTDFKRPVDVLINHIGAKAPDLNKLVLGIIMVPVGLDPEEEYF